MKNYRLFIRSIAFSAFALLLTNCGNNGAANKETGNSSDMTSVKENNQTVNSYVTFIKQDTSTMSLDHAFTKKALTDLSSAVEAMAGETNFDVKADLDKVNGYARQITQDYTDVSHADSIKVATGMLATALQNMQKAKYPGLGAEAEALVRASEAIDPDKLALEQRDAIKSYFSKAADLLQNMN